MTGLLKVFIALSLTVLEIKSDFVIIPALGALNGNETQGAFTGRKIYQFRGVNYAESPSGIRRFKAPTPVLPWTGVRDATQIGRECPTTANTMAANSTVDLEDCLNLSVYSTNLTARFPVMVYFHGGGFYEGAANHHPPNYLLEENVILVVVQYRLGALGFLSTISAPIPGNAALLDCVLALNWVKSYISYFGGDPNRVTIFGQSAGAAIVSGLILSPSVPENLYHGAIMQSGSAFGSWAIDGNPVQNARVIASLGGCRENASLDELNTCLMSMDLKSMLRASDHASASFAFTEGGPTNIFPQSPYKILRTGGGFRNIPVMAGVTKHDGSFVLATAYDYLMKTIGVNNSHFNTYQLIDTINELVGIEDPTNSLAGFEIATLFPNQTALINGDFKEMIEPLVDICNVLGIKGPVLRAVQAQVSKNSKATYLYSFDYRGEFTRFGYGADTQKYPFDGGIHHSNDNIYLFPWPLSVSKLNPRDIEVAKRMVKLWTSFATTGVPSAPGMVEWPAMSRINGPYLHINFKPSVGQNFYEEYSVTVRDGLSRESSGNKLSGGTFVALALVALLKKVVHF